MVDDVAKEFADKGLIVLAVDVLEPDQKVKKYLAEHPRSVPFVLTKDTNLAAMYRIEIRITEFSALTVRQRKLSLFAACRQTGSHTETGSEN